MILNSAAHSSRDQPAPAILAALLADLKGAHANLATTIGVLRSLTIGRVPDRGDYAAAGWRINQAS